MPQKIYYSLLGVSLSIIVSSFNFASADNPAPAERNPVPAGNFEPRKAGIKTIIIDAGHGGRDRGARGHYSLEKDVCLAIALKLGKKMKQQFPDIKIFYTRTGDTYPAIKARADFANAHKGDLFISIHANAAPRIRHSKFAGYKTQVYYTRKGKKKIKHTRRVKKYTVYYTNNPSRGAETYIWAADRSKIKGEFVGERMAEEVNQSTEYTPDINDPVFRAKSLLWTKRYFNKSLLLANMVQQEMAKEGRLNRGVKQRNEKGIWVLQATAMPSILVETGYLTNRAEENYLNSKKGQEEIASAIVKAVKRYRNETQPHSSNSFKNSISSRK